MRIRRRKTSKASEQRRESGNERSADGRGWCADDAAALLEVLGQATQLIAASVQEHGNLDLIRRVSGRARAGDGPALIAEQFGHLRGVLKVTAQSWGLSLDSLVAEEESRGSYLRSVAAARATRRGSLARGWQLEQAGELLQGLALVAAMVAGTIAAAGRIELVPTPFAAGDDVDGREWLALYFGHLRAALDVYGHQWGLPLVAMGQAEMGVIWNLRAGTTRA